MPGSAGLRDTGERMEPAARPGEEGKDGDSGPAEGTSAGGREPGVRGDWAGGAGGNWMAIHPTVGVGGSGAARQRPGAEAASSGARR